VAGSLRSDKKRREPALAGGSQVGLPAGKLEKGGVVAVRIRMKLMGRKHRPYFRIVAIDARQPRDGRVIEELCSYDPMIKNTDDRVKLRPDRVRYWMSVGARPSENVAVLIRKYLTKAEQQVTAATTAAAEAAAPKPEPTGETAPPPAPAEAPPPVV